MAEDKIIVEMAKDVWKASCAGHGIECTKCEYANNSTDKYSCVDFVISQNLYKAGYRKKEWISVEDRLPEEDGRYLVYVDIEHSVFELLTTVVTMEYSINHGFYAYHGKENVTHWMPLPQPPETKGETE